MHRSAAVLGVVGLCILAGCSSSPKAIALPTPGAGPREVLSVYLRALKAGDCGTAVQLTVPGSFVDNGGRCGIGKVNGYTVAAETPLMPNGEVSFQTTLDMYGAQGIQQDATWSFTLRQQNDGEWRLVGGGSNG